MEKTTETQQETKVEEPIKLLDSECEIEKNFNLCTFVGTYKNETKTMLAIKFGNCKCHLQKGDKEFDEQVELFINTKTKLPALAYKGEIMGIGWHDFIKFCINNLGLFSEPTNTTDKGAE